MIGRSKRLIPSCQRKFAAPSLFYSNTVRGYHTYPDPDEKPQISYSKSDSKQQLNKSEFKLDKKFGFDVVFPGYGVSNGIGSSVSTPATYVSKLSSNGLTVASQDLPGLMTSFALIIRAGR
jgi:hypothetical protein